MNKWVKIQGMQISPYSEGLVVYLDTAQHKKMCKKLRCKYECLGDLQSEILD